MYGQLMTMVGRTYTWQPVSGGGGGGVNEDIITV